MSKFSRRAFMKAGAAIGFVGAPSVASANAAAETVATSAPASASAYPFRWWVSLDGGDVFCEEFDSREEAVQAALGYGGGEIAECQQQDFDLRIDGDELFELMHGRNEELIGEGDFIDVSNAQLQELEDQVNAVILAWTDKHKLHQPAWQFGAVRNREKIAPPAPAQAREEK